MQQALQRAIGIGDASYSPGDRALSGFLVILGLYETFCFLVPLVMWAADAQLDFLAFWYVWLCVNFLLALIFSVWFSGGGIIDLKAFFERLSTATRDDSDDGTVTPSSLAAEALILHSDGGIELAVEHTAPPTSQTSGGVEAGQQGEDYVPPSLESSAAVTAL